MFVTPRPTLTALSLSALLALSGYAPISQAFNFGDMMNPNRWMGGDRYDERYEDGYYGGPYGPQPYGYGYPGAYGGPYSSPYAVPGFGAPPTGYGAPGSYGGATSAVPAAPAVPTVPAAPAVAPAPAAGASSVVPSEVEALKRRIEELEAKQPPPQTAPSTDWPTSAPAFRPMNQY